MIMIGEANQQRSENFYKQVHTEADAVSENVLLVITSKRFNKK